VSVGAWGGGRGVGRGVGWGVFGGGGEVGGGGLRWCRGVFRARFGLVGGWRVGNVFRGKLTGGVCACNLRGW